ncbi:T9SS type A sorting domain-containing protein [Terrimonas sp. NA20]|uniref:T9SS type A sorting domain-containing protein n=1 Tax=Terrimonas ginsenosidimutans TaxID=2908004 RepID=A0ABS9KWA6_9BACT|nr:T9SS type A sorting domain-containing protein [Terrimonas ginsenosidimutans]MCG2616649.1 T9SS type A sorting domain-containing protein [Terrimonas ginsenosidimutans]
MKSLFFYLVQVVVVSGILYAYYHFALRNKKFHQYNRFYILAATLASVLIPFLNIPVYFTEEDKWMYALQNLSGPAVVINVDPSAEVEKPFNWQGLLYCFYALVAVAGVAKVLVSVYRLKKIMRRHPAEHLNGIRFINTSEPGTPFSFFRWLFWNDRIELSSQKGEQIFRHEVYHIEQKHSIDSVFMEIITIVFWINPFFHLMKKELKAIHEFLADRFASHDTEKWEYAEMLLMQALNTQHSLVQPFFHNQIKRRIAMITNPQKTSHQYLRKLLVLPLGALLITLFAFSYQKKSPDLLAEVTVTDIQPAVIDSLPDGKTDIRADVFTVKGDGFNAQNQKVKPQLIIFNGKRFNSDEFAAFTGKKGKNVVIEAMYVVSTPPNDKNAILQYGEQARDGVLEFKAATLDTVPAVKANSVRISASPVPGKEPLIVLDGVVKDRDDYKLTLQQLDPDKIQSISILKDASATGLYGDKGKNGVMLITTKKDVEVKELRLETLPGVVVTDSGRLIGTGAKTRVTNLQIKPIEEVKAGTQSNKLEEVTVVGYGTKKATGDQVIEVRQVPSNSIKGQIEEVPVKGKLQSVTIENVSRTFTKVEVEPAFPGGASAWYSFLTKNLDAASPAKNNAPAGEYTVQVRMKVSDDGRLSDFKALTNHGFGMEAAAIRALENSPYWNPAYQNGKAVNAIKTQAFTFVVKGETPKLQEVTISAIPSVSVYPNPANDRVFVRLEGSEEREVTVRIVDMGGKEKMRSSIKKVKGSTVNGFNIGSLAPGTYILNVEGKGMTSSSHKFVKE